MSTELLERVRQTLANANANPGGDIVYVGVADLEALLCAAEREQERTWALTVLFQNMSSAEVARYANALPTSDILRMNAIVEAIGREVTTATAVAEAFG